MLLVALPGCSGGDSSAVKVASCTNNQSFCLLGCSLGCSTVGCGVTEIAQNQPLELRFSRPVDAGSVNGASVSIQTATGRPAAGRLLVSGSNVVFEPSLRVVGGQTIFGFLSGETYILTLPGGPGEGQSVRSASGDPLSHSITCTMTVSRGIIDLDGLPPRGTLLSPTATTNVPIDATIVIQFSEIIDVSPFQGGTTANSPIEYRVSSAPNGQCDEQQARIFIPGVPQVVTDPVARRSQVILAPAAPLPFGSCVEVAITNRLTDLAGTPAEPVVYLVNVSQPVPVARMLVVDQPKELRIIAESFDTAAQLDSEFSSGAWGGGVAVPGQIGGSGILGDFDITLGQQISTNVWLWDTESMTIPRTHTFTGQDITVADGVFNFARFRVPAGNTLKFTGSFPPRIIVRGSVLIDGNIDLSAPNMVEHLVLVPPALTPNPVGQIGGVGGIMGGDGGAGGEMGDGVTNDPRFDGQNGETVQLLGGHAYAGGPPTGRQDGTGGIGSQQFPLDGLNASVTMEGLVGSAQVSAGGGGGGFAIAGQTGRVVQTSCSPGCASEGPPAAGGNAFNLFPVPPVTPPQSRLDHFLVGGSGGGGAGTHPFISSPISPMWRSGAGGAGGGGAISFRAGGDLKVIAGAQVVVRGGSGFGYNYVPCASPGGAGSGGSCLMQVGGTVEQFGRIDASGGVGGVATNTSPVAFLDVRGGNGAPGFILLENGATEPLSSLLGATIPAATALNVDPLTETDDIVGSQSKWFATNETLPPPVLRYQMVVEQDGVDVVYSDDPAFGILAAGSTPVQLWMQAARIDPGTGIVDPTSARPWRTYAGPDPSRQPALVDDFSVIASTSRTARSTAFRFLLLFDTTVMMNLRVKDFVLVYTVGTL